MVKEKLKMGLRAMIEKHKQMREQELEEQARQQQLETEMNDQIQNIKHSILTKKSVNAPDP